MLQMTYGPSEVTLLWILGAVAISCVITMGLRLLPFAVFRGEKELPNWLAQLGNALPAAIMAVLVIYCLKDCGEDAKGIGLPKILACLSVVLIHKWKHNTFLSILVGTVIYMILIRIMIF